MNKEQVKGFIDQVTGVAKRKAGELTEDTPLQVEGMVQQAKGKVETAWGKTKETVVDAIQDAELHINAQVQLKTKHSPSANDHK